MSDHDAAWIPFIIIIGIYILILMIIHFGKLAQKMIFPVPQSNYTENYFREKLFYANIYKHDGNVVNSFPQQNSNLTNLEKIRNVPYVYLKNKYSVTNQNIIHFHGNAEDLYAASYFMEELMKTINANIFLVEYPRYGIYESNQAPCSQLIEEDALAVYDHIKSEFQLTDNQIYIFGRSIGTGPAFHVASNRKVKGLIVMSAYLSIREIINDFCCRCGILLNIFFCLPNFFINSEKCQQVKCPIVFIHGQDDQLIKPRHSEQLYQNLNLEIQQRSRLFIRERMTHNDFDREDDIAQPILETFQDLKQQRF